LVVLCVIARNVSDEAIPVVYEIATPSARNDQKGNYVSLII